MRANRLLPAVLLLLLAASCPKPKPVAAPSRPRGTVLTEVHESGTYRTVAFDPELHDIRYAFDFGDGRVDSTGFYPSGETAHIRHDWRSAGTHEVKARALTDDGRASAEWSEPLAVTVKANSRPAAPDSVEGPLATTLVDTLIFRARTTDSDTDPVYISFRYALPGDTTIIGYWRGPVTGGTWVYDTVPLLRAGEWRIRAVARDARHAISDSGLMRQLMLFKFGTNESWQFASSRALHFGRSPAVAPGSNRQTILATADSDSIYAARDNENGLVRVDRGWTGAGLTTRGAPVVSNDGLRCYIPCSDNRLWTFDIARLTLQYAWSDSSGAPVSEPATALGKVYFGQGDTLYCLLDNGAGLTRQWACHIFASPLFPPAVNSGAIRVYCGNDSGFFCVNKAGQLFWQNRDVGAPTTAFAEATDGTIFVGAGAGKLIGLNGSTGEVVFKSQAGGEFAGAPVIAADNTVYAARRNGTVHAFRDGREVWTHSFSPAQISAAPCLAPDSTLVIHLDDDRLVALAQSDGAERWQFALPVPARAARSSAAAGSSPTIGPSYSRIYVGGTSAGRLYGIRVNLPAYAQGLPAAPWPKYQHDNSNSGYPGTARGY